ncbi:MAG: KH domain-containing protein [Nitrospirota bacterium]
MKTLVELIARSLVDRPEDVVVTEIVGEKTALFELRVASSDIGKIVGKQGNTARAIRTILSAAGAKLKKRCVLEILD